jgi:cytochrome c oxidase subunit 2
VDHLHYTLTAITLFFTILIFALIFYFMIKYRRRSPDVPLPATSASAPPSAATIMLEITWTLIPTLICAGLFFWGASMYFTNAAAPAGAMEVFVTGRQWMWKIQHPEGMREINELHVPVGRPVRLTMTSEDVIHDFFVPAFRIKKDVLPGRYTSLWFTATKPGKYHLFCAQYCGAFHAGMGGWVFVMEQNDYQRWLTSGAPRQTMESAGEQLFADRGCSGCHGAEAAGRAPSLVGLFGRTIQTPNGPAKADEAYLREAILNPHAPHGGAYPVAMPVYQGQLSEEQLLDLIAYVRSLGAQEQTQR